MGKLGDFGKLFEKGMSPEEFKTAFTQLVLEKYNAAWTLFGDTPKGRHAVGMIFGYMPVGHTVIIMDIVWFPWASSRNVMEGFANWVNALRDEMIVLDFTMPKDKPFFDRICRLGLMRLVGAVHDIYQDGPAYLHQSKRPQKLRVY